VRPNPDKPGLNIEDLWYRFALSFLLKSIVRQIGTKLFPRLRSGKVAPAGQLSEPKLELQLSNQGKPASGS
jgi:hypothetical protein